MNRAPSRMRLSRPACRNVGIRDTPTAASFRRLLPQIKDLPGKLIHVEPVVTEILGRRSRCAPVVPGFTPGRLPARLAGPD